MTETQREQRARSLGNLAPATSEQFGNELTACLAWLFLSA
jgi:hypothetical protein